MTSPLVWRIMCVISWEVVTNYITLIFARPPTFLGFGTLQNFRKYFSHVKKLCDHFVVPPPQRDVICERIPWGLSKYYASNGGSHEMAIFAYSTVQKVLTERGHKIKKCLRFWHVQNIFLHWKPSINDINGKFSEVYPYMYPTLVFLCVLLKKHVFLPYIP